MACISGKVYLKQVYVRNFTDHKNNLSICQKLIQDNQNPECLSIILHKGEPVDNFSIPPELLSFNPNTIYLSGEDVTVEWNYPMYELGVRWGLTYLREDQDTEQYEKKMKLDTTFEYDGEEITIDISTMIVDDGVIFFENWQKPPNQSLNTNGLYKRAVLGRFIAIKVATAFNIYSERPWVSSTFCIKNEIP